MTSRERILASVSGKERDRIPWAPLCSASFFAGLPEYQKKFDLQPQSSNLLVPTIGNWKKHLAWRVKFYRENSMDFMGWVEGTDFALAWPDTINKTVTNTGTSFLRETTTPLGKLTSAWQYQPSSYTTFPIKYKIEELKDLTIAALVAEKTKVSPSYDEGRQYLDVVGENGVAFTGAPPAPVQEGFLGSFNPQRLLLWTQDEPEELLKYEEAQYRLNLEICRVRASGPFQLFESGVVGLALVSPQIIRKHYFPFLKECNEVFKSKGKTLLHHTSGEPVGSILDDIARIGLGGLHGLSYPAPRNTPEIWEIAERLPSETVLCGGPTPDFLCREKPEQIKNMIRRLLEKMAGNKRFLLGTADDVVPGTPVENLEAVSEVVEEFG